ncbi:transforming protein [Human papillomavirus 140]|uniref:Protein E7 n=1 Tax=Human papillomavirus 140 TaxID=1070413 RepID=I3P6M5_9PAPI|nr:transforming protein [Human papillomavirus 140]AEM24629.1 transforming protein [Human papillomavirus 140]
MMGNAPTIKDIELDAELGDLILPSQLLCEESLSPDDSPEEELLSPYRVDSLCNSCTARVRLCVVATADAIQFLERLLFRDLSIVCPRCSRDVLRHGRTQ